MKYHETNDILLLFQVRAKIFSTKQRKDTEANGIQQVRSSRILGNHHSQGISGNGLAANIGTRIEFCPVLKYGLL